jgi:hypothetical protein
MVASAGVMMMMLDGLAYNHLFCKDPSTNHRIVALRIPIAWVDYTYGKLFAAVRSAACAPATSRHNPSFARAPLRDAPWQYPCRVHFLFITGTILRQFSDFRIVPAQRKPLGDLCQRRVLAPVK